MDNIFERQIAQTDLEAKQDKWNRSQAIKEHKKLSKCIDNCWWCLDSKNMLRHMIVTMDSVICLSWSLYIDTYTACGLSIAIR